jgi:hypothetical protein
MRQRFPTSPTIRAAGLALANGVQEERNYNARFQTSGVQATCTGGSLLLGYDYPASNNNGNSAAR